MNGLYICHHLGLGDAIICNALYRILAAQNEMVVLPVKYHNVPSVQYMLRDVPNILIRPVEDDEEMIMFRDVVWKGQVLGLGLFSGKPFKGAIFDQEFYRQLDIDFQARWDGWRLQRDPAVELPLPGLRGNYCFVHDDIRRGMCIDTSRIDSEKYPIIERPKPTASPNMFAYLKIIEEAEQIHCINSSFALFIDSIDLPKNPKLFLHLYSRPESEIPTFKKEWVRLT